MKHRIWQSKSLLLRRIHHQKENTLCKMILKEQSSRKWPGLAAEVKDICMALGIPDLNANDIPVSQLTKAVLNHNYKNIKEELESCKKMEKYNDFHEIHEPECYRKIARCTTGAKGFYF